MTYESKLQELLEPPITHLGFRLAGVNWLGSGKHKTLELVIDNFDYSPINISDCEEVSHTASAILDVEDVIPYQYHLRVSSPGIDRDLFTMRDYQQFVGQEVKIWLHQPLLLNDQPQLKLTGTLSAADDNTITLARSAEPKTISIDYNSINRGKLILTDALLAATQPNTNTQ